MSSLPLTTHDTLLFDVLGVIFSHYALEETIHHPLETLLLVSRSWADAALGHRAIWGHLNIYLGHNPTSKIWRARLPLRLARAGPITPLYIDVRNYLDMPYCLQAHKDVQEDLLFLSIPCREGGYDFGACICYMTARASVHEALERVAGTSGELCARWKSFKLDLGHTERHINGTALTAIPLSYPTPHLTTLSLKNLRFNHDILFPLFPSVPEMKDVTMVDCNLPSFSSFESIRQATIGWKDNILNSPGLSVICHATGIKILHVHLPVAFTGDAARMCFPDRLDSLQVLHINGNTLPLQLYSIQMPKLSSVTLEYTYGILLSHFLTCKGFVGQNLRHITLLWKLRARPTPEEIQETLSSLQMLLLCARNLDSITVEKETLGILLELIWLFATSPRLPGQSIKGPLVEGICIINSEVQECVYLCGDETPERLEEIAAGWDLVRLQVSQQEFISQLQVSRFPLFLISIAIILTTRKKAQATLRGNFNDGSDWEVRLAAAWLD
jgi:hypothetical protein